MCYTHSYWLTLTQQAAHYKSLCYYKQFSAAQHSRESSSGEIWSVPNYTNQIKPLAFLHNFTTNQQVLLQQAFLFFVSALTYLLTFTTQSWISFSLCVCIWYNSLGILVVYTVCLCVVCQKCQKQKYVGWKCLHCVRTTAGTTVSNSTYQNKNTDKSFIEETHSL